MKNNKIFFLPSPQHPSYLKRGFHLRWNAGFLRAQLLYRPLWAIKHALGFGPQIIWGQRVSFLSSVRTHGPGRIILGDDIILDARPDLYTHDSAAEILIGNKSFINGTRIGCSLKVQIGEKCIIADTRIMDTDFHSLSRQRISPAAVVKTGAVIVESNVWIAAGSALLKGITIGQDSVVAFGSVVVSSIAAGKIAAGNPAKEIAEIPD